MPNWCNNILTVAKDGSKAGEEQLTEFIERAIRYPNEEKKIDGCDFHLHGLYPMPDSLKITAPQSDRIDQLKAETNEYLHGHTDWYEWRVAKWGTKWDVDGNMCTDPDDDTIVYEFSSAWSPPVAWLAKVCEDFPNLTFTLEYNESGCNFRGEAVAYKGALQADNCWNMTMEDYEELGYDTSWMDEDEEEPEEGEDE